CRLSSPLRSGAPGALTSRFSSWTLRCWVSLGEFVVQASSPARCSRDGRTTSTDTTSIQKQIDLPPAQGQRSPSHSYLVNSLGTHYSRVPASDMLSRGDGRAILSHCHARKTHQFRDR